MFQFFKIYPLSQLIIDRASGKFFRTFFSILKKIKWYYHPNAFRGEYVFPLIIKFGMVLENVGRVNWDTLAWFNVGLVMIILEKEG